jgi:ribonuclease P/MRP protein subunit RPP1
VRGTQEDGPGDGGPYAAVHARPEGEATVARMALTAAEAGYDGVVVRNHGDADARPTSLPAVAGADGSDAADADRTDAADTPDADDADADGAPDVDPADGRYDPARVAEAYGIDVVPGIEIRTDDRAQAAGLLSRYREERVVVCVDGGSLNRWAVEDPRVDVLAHPTRGDGDVNHVLVKAARENGVRLEFDLSRVLRRSGGERVQALRGLRKLREIVDYYDAPYVVSADPTSHLHVRSPRALRAVAAEIGFEPGTVDRGLAEWGRLATRNRDRLSESFLASGVRRGRYEEID